MAFSSPVSIFVKLPHLPLYTLRMRTNATYLYTSAPGVTFDCLCINLLLHNKKKCDLVANSGSCVQWRSYSGALAPPSVNQFITFTLNCFMHRYFKLKLNSHLYLYLYINLVSLPRLPFFSLTFRLSECQRKKGSLGGETNIN